MALVASTTSRIRPTGWDQGAEKARSMTGFTWLPIPSAKRPSEISWRS